MGRCALAHSETLPSGVVVLRCGSSSSQAKPDMNTGLTMTLHKAASEHGENTVVVMPICPGSCPAFIGILNAQSHDHLGDHEEKL